MSDKQLDLIEDLIRDSVENQREINKKLVMHHTALCILAGTLTVMTPIVAAWGFKMNSNLAKLDTATGILEQRFNYHERISVGKEVITTDVDAAAEICVSNRVAMARRPIIPILCVDG